MGERGPKVPRRFREREAAIYRAFADGDFDFTEAALAEMYLYESRGGVVSERNGYYVGKQRLQLSMDLWCENIAKGLLTPQELYEDSGFAALPGFVATFVRPRVEVFVRGLVRRRQAFGVGAFLEPLYG